MKPSNVQPPAEPQAAQNDLLGEATTLPSPGLPPQATPMPERTDGTSAAPPPSEDENQPAFIGERNLPRP